MDADYRKWYTSANAKEKILANIKKSGLPLELRTRKILQNFGFTVSDARYFEPSAGEMEISVVSRTEGLWRELDILARKYENTNKKIGGCEIEIYTNIVAECKYSSDKDILVFEHLDAKNANLSRFPIPACGHHILPMNPAKYFMLPMLAERVIALKSDSVTREKDNYNDRIVHDACEQVLKGLRYFLNEWIDTHRIDYLNQGRKSLIFKEWEKIEKPWEHKSIPLAGIVRRNFIDNFLNENVGPKTLDDFTFVPIDLYFPLLVMDESRGIIKVNLDDMYNPIDLEDIGCCLYLYISENANKYETVLGNSFALPVLICNLRNLDRVIKLIIDGLEELGNQVVKLITSNPSLIVKEILFNEKVIGIQ